MRLLTLAVFGLSLTVAQVAQAQRIARIGFAPRPAVAARVASKAAALPGNSGMPRWVRWGLVGAIGGAALFTLADALNNGRHSVGSDILAGAATGFVVIGGGVLVYDAICSPGSNSHSGFCGR